MNHIACCRSSCSLVRIEKSAIKYFGWNYKCDFIIKNSFVIKLIKKKISQNGRVSTILELVHVNMLLLNFRNFAQKGTSLFPKPWTVGKK